MNETINKKPSASSKEVKILTNFDGSCVLQKAVLIENESQNYFTLLSQIPLIVSMFYILAFFDSTFHE